MLFRTNPAAGLAKAQTALAATEARIVELEQERQTVLAEADTVEPVHALDLQISGLRAAAQTHADRIAVLRAAAREQQAEQLEAQRQAALAEVQKRLDAQVELAREVEHAVKQLGQKWNQLLQWRTAILSAWPESLPRPTATDFYDVGPLRRELGNALFGESNAAWNRIPSIPGPIAPIGVEGLSPKGIAGYVAAAGAALLRGSGRSGLTIPPMIPRRPPKCPTTTHSVPVH
jgi:hypothetical protein